MGLFDLLFHKNRRKSENSNYQNFSDDEYAREIQKQFYSKYPEIPYVSPNRDKNWLNMVELSPKALVNKKMMKRNQDDLLPGEVYLLYWITHRKKRKDYPAYFEFKYGIDPVQSTNLLEKEGLLDGIKITEKGNQILDQYNKIIEQHSPTTTSSKKSLKRYSSEEAISIADDAHDLFTIESPFEENEMTVSFFTEEDQKLFLSDLQLINQLIAKVNKKFFIERGITIRLDMISFRTPKTKGMNKAYIHSHFKTATGRKSKYALTAYFQANDLPYTTVEEKNAMRYITKYEVHGWVDYFEDGRIGKAQAVIWHYKNEDQGYVFDFQSISTGLAVKKVTRLQPVRDGRQVVIYNKDLKGL